MTTGQSSASPAGAPRRGEPEREPEESEPHDSEHSDPELHDSEPEVEEAFRWEGDEADRRIARPAPRPASVEPAADDDQRHGGSAAGLVAFGVVVGVLLLEAVGWVAAILGPISGTIDAGSGSPAELVSFVLNVTVRITAVAAAPVWFGFVVWRIPAGARRVAALAVGALVLIPWPALVHA